MKTSLIVAGILLVLIVFLGMKALLFGALCGVAGYSFGKFMERE
jgi:hypothetical protein